ncbi:MAG: hypothetical protein HRT94_03980 [Alphaproteobacteria bacterium]|nr:hypothetical protein [Alphaproteobacteria bacterium]
MSTIAIDAEHFEIDEDQLEETSALQDTLRSSFQRFAEAVQVTTHKIGSLAYDFFKANPIVTAVGVDLATTGGAFTQMAIVGTVETIASAAGELTHNAATELWNYIMN